MAFIVKDALDRAQPSELGDLLKTVPLGTTLSDLSTPTSEAVAVAANVGTLAYLPASVLAVYSTAGSVAKKAIIPAGVGPIAGEVAVNYATGVLTFAAADGVTACVAVYHKASGRTGLATSWPQDR